MKIYKSNSVEDTASAPVNWRLSLNRAMLLLWLEIWEQEKPLSLRE